MKLLSFVRLFGENWGHKRSNRKHRIRVQPNLRRKRLLLEWLEDRTLLSDLPAPLIPYAGHQDLTGQLTNHNTPAIAVDPVDPSKVVAVYQSPLTVEGMYSANFGKPGSWFSLPLATSTFGNLVDPKSLAGNPFAQSTDASVAFDRDENVYVVHAEHNALANPPTNMDQGAIVLQKFSFKSFAPTSMTLRNHIGVPQATAGQTVLYEGVLDLALTPMLAVDTNVHIPASQGGPFRDPITGAIQDDPLSGAIYVAWSTQDIPGSGNAFANNIKVVGSADGGATFSTQTYVASGSLGRPRLVVSQGRADGRGPTAGQVTLVYDNFSPPPGSINSAGIQDGVYAGYGDNQKSITIPEAQGGNTLMFNTAASTPITVPAAGQTASTMVPFAPVTTDTTIMKVTVKLNISLTGTLSKISSLRAILISPDGKTKVTLFTFGLPNPATGLGQMNGTVFDDAAGQPITAGMSPFTGMFTPNQALAAFNKPGLGGPWTLEIDNNDANTTGAVNTCMLMIEYASIPQFAGSFIQLSAASFPNVLANLLSSDLDVTVGLNHGDLTEVSVQLVQFQAGYDPRTDPNFNVNAPSTYMSHVDKQIYLLHNRVDEMGMMDPSRPGTSGINLGTTLSGFNLGTVFDDEAPRSIIETFPGDNPNNSMAPFTGHFQTDGDKLTTWRKKTVTDLSRVWMLRVGDYQHQDMPPQPQQLNFWSMNFTFGLTPKPLGAIPAFLGSALLPPYAYKVNALPEVGVGPSVSIAADNTLGSFSPYQGRLYLTYVARNSPLVDDLEIFLVVSDNGGKSWINPDPTSPLPAKLVNDDIGSVDGFSGASVRTRVKFQPEVAVDNYTGTLAITYYDARYDASRTRVARMLATSPDGGQTFGPTASQVYLNIPNRVLDVITRQFVDLGPIPDNEGMGNPLPTDTPRGTRDAVYGFGDRQGLAFAQGHVYAVWAGNRNQGNLGIETAVVTLPSGPRVVDSTMGPIINDGVIIKDGRIVAGPPYNNTFDANHVRQLDGFVVTFDRPVDIGTFTPADVSVFYRDPNTSGFDPGQPILVTQVIPILPNAGGTTVFLVRIMPQSRTGTYSYLIRPNMRDLIRTVDKFTNGFTNNIRSGNLMDQDGDTNLDQFNKTGQTPSDIYAAPSPGNTSRFTGTMSPPFTLAGYFTPPFNQDSLPLIVPGPHVVKTFVPGQPATSDNLVQNAKVSFLDVTFDRNMNLATFHASDVLRLMGPTGQISGPFTVAPDPQPGEDPAHPRTFRISFATQELSGTYTLTIGPNVQSATGDAMDANVNAGVDKLKGQPPPGQGTPLVIGNTTPLVILSGRTITSTINVTDDFIIQLLSVRLRITFPFDPDLEATLIAPDGTRVRLFANVLRHDPPMVPFLPPPNENFSDTGFDDFAPSSIRDFQFPIRGFAPFQGEYRPESPLRSLIGKHSKGTWSLEVKNDGMHVGSFNNFTLTFQQTTPVVYASPSAPVAIPPANPPTQTQTTITSVLDVPDDFLIQGATLSLNISHPSDSDLEATLIAPDGTQIALFTNLPANTGNQADFTDTIFDDQGVKPIQQAGPPYFGRFKPQQPLSQLNGKNARGRYTLQIKNDGTNAGVLNSWSLTLKKPIPISGLGEPVADQTETSFRIFTMAVDNPLSHSQWTAVGPAADFDPLRQMHHSGRIGGIAVDPSDPSANTVYVAGATGGVWKSTNFLTPDPNGPTYIPLTDFGPAFGINIGGIAVFGRNNDPNQSIIFAATGEGDVHDSMTGVVGFEGTHVSPGVGFLRSMDGGATWTLLDSLTNVDASGNILPFDQRKHELAGTVAYKIVVDPKPRPSGDVIIFAAMGASNADASKRGIYRSLDSGKHWENVTANVIGLQGDEATDVVLDPNSGRFNTDDNPTGNLQIVYAAFRNNGVWVSPESQGTSWNKLLGLDGGLTIVSGTTPIPVNPPSGTPTGKGRIVLAKPALTGMPLQDQLYEGWLYAVAVDAANTPTGGVYMTKDYGHNWTRIRFPSILPPTGVPTNDTTKADYDVLGNQGDYDVDVAVDPTNPNILYVGGMARIGFIRLDATGVSDPYALYLGSDRVETVDNGEPGADSGKLLPFTTDPVTPILGAPQLINVVADPFAPFVNDAIVQMGGLFSRIANSGAGVRWTVFTGALEGTADHHRLVTFKDPLTGHARLIWGDDQGVFSAVDRNGTLITGIGNAPAPGPGSRNGNLQITQFYYGAAQPNNLAAQVSVLNTSTGYAQYPGLFYGQAQDNGSGSSDPAVLDNGNLSWTGPAGDGAGIVTDQTGSGTVFRYNWPCCGGRNGNFLQLNAVGRTSGLNPLDRTEWPDVDGFAIAINPLKGDAANGQLLVSSFTGRIYETTNAGIQWFLIADPTAAGMDGTNAHALAYGAPDPKAPNGGSSLKDFIYAGTDGGHIYVTFTGGGSPSAGNQWKDISGGLDGASVRFIVTNPTRGSHEAYAVTFGHVYHMVDSQQYDPANAKTFWQDVTGNLYSLTSDLFAPLNEKGSSVIPLQDTQLRYLEALQADWRYAIPDNPLQIGTPPTGLVPIHPILYVGGEGGVYRSLDGGTTWTHFPDTAIDGSKYEGGLLPNAHVTELNLSIGNITTATGQPTVFGSPDVLLATTYGRGDFAIRVAPLVFGSPVMNSVRLDPTLPKPGGSNPLGNNVTPLTQVVVTGLSEPSAFGNHVKIKLYNRVRTGPGPNDFRDDDIGVDVNNPNQPFAYTDEQGRFHVQVRAGYFQADGTSDGLKTVVVVAIDDAGVVGTPSLLSFTLNTTPLFHADSIRLDPTRPALPGGSDSGLQFPFPGAVGTFTDKLTNVADPWIAGVLDQPGITTLRLFDVTDATNPRLIGSGTSNADGTFSVHVTPGSFTTDGVKLISIQAVHVPIDGRLTQPFSFTLRTTPPAQPPAPDLAATSDTGFSNSDHITNIHMPTFTGTGEPGTQVQVYYVGNATPIALGFVNSTGNHSVTVGPNALPDGTYVIYVRLSDLAGNLSPGSVALQPSLTIMSTPPAKPTIRLDPAYEASPGTTFSVPQLYDGTADPGTQVVIKDNGVLVDSFLQAAGSNTFSRTLSLGEGTHVVTVESSDIAGNVAVSDDLIITVNKDTLDPDHKFIRQVYFNALGRLGSLPEWNIWLPQLQKPNGRSSIADGIERSLEARDFLVKGWYLTYLGRPASNGEELGWANAVVRGMRPEQALSLILASQEYFNHAPSVPGVGGVPSDAAFVTALYAQVLNRVPAPPEVDGWVGLIPRIGRAGVALDFLLSQEYRTNAVQADYSTILRRTIPATPPEVAGWVQSGLDITAIRIGFEASVEFYFRTTGFLP